jgi:SNF2 family DNA or RNA helicase
VPRAELLRLIAPHFLRRRKREVLPQLPPILAQDLELQLLDRQRAAYDALWFDRDRVVSAAGRPVPTAALFALLTRLKQLCNFEPESGQSAKLEVLATMVDGLAAPEDKILIFSQYVETLRWLSARLRLPHGLYHGDLDEAERERALAEFQEKPGPRGLLVSLKAGGVGLNLQAASAVVLFDRWWNPAVESQAVFRAHRFDRQAPLHVVRFIVRDTIEERIRTILAAKAQLFEDYVESATTTDVPTFTRRDLLRVLGLDDEPSGA